ncbi:MAG: hypothetical protein ACI97A_003574, partial [Planctomycetota bacterium]
MKTFVWMDDLQSRQANKPDTRHRDVVIARRIIGSELVIFFLLVAWRFFVLNHGKPVGFEVMFYFYVMPASVVYIGLTWATIPRVRLASSMKRMVGIGFLGIMIPIGTSLGVMIAQLTSQRPEWEWIWGAWAASFVSISPLVFAAIRRMTELRDQDLGET